MRLACGSAHSSAWNIEWNEAMYLCPEASVRDAVALLEYILLRRGATVPGPRLAFSVIRLAVRAHMPSPPPPPPHSVLKSARI